MRLVVTFVSHAAIIAVCLGGCFAPELGNMPFQCSATGKDCPDGYRCEEVKKLKVCVPEESKRDGAVTDSPLLTDAELEPSKERPFRLDGAKVQNPSNCIDVSSEPNNNLDKSTDMNQAGSGNIPGWEICYSGDIDVYKWSRTIGDKLIVEIKFFHNKGDLELALFSPDGGVLAESRSEDDNERVAMNTTPVDGDYLVAVWGFKGATNKYDLIIDK